MWNLLTLLHLATDSKPSESSSCDSIHMRELGVCRCRCTLIDVGLNTGASLVSWAPEVVANGQAGNASAALDACARDKTTCYYGFEANPAYEGSLLLMANRLKERGRRVRVFTSTAFNIHAGKAIFHLEPARRGTEQRGSTLAGERFITYHHKATNRTLVGKGDANHLFKGVEVTSVDAASFLREVAAASDYVAAKIDVEGFEYALLSHLLLHDPRALCSLRAAFFEWHPNKMPAHVVADEEHLRWAMRHRLCNVTVGKWY